MCNLVEKNFIIGKDKFHSEIIKNSFPNKWDDEYINKMGHIVYIDTLPHRPIIASVCIESTNKRESTFLDLLKTINNSDFNSILILVTTYPRYLNLFNSNDFSSFKRNIPLDNFLIKSSGFLLYHHQLEHLFIMGTGSDKEQSENFRKNINKKKSTTFEESKKIQIFGSSLYEVIFERMKLSITYNPDYYSSHLLFNHLNNY